MNLVYVRYIYIRYIYMFDVLYRSTVFSTGSFISHDVTVILMRHTATVLLNHKQIRKRLNQL